MKLSTAVKPITYLKAHAAEILQRLERENSAMVITQNGEAKAVLMGIREYEHLKEALALLRIAAQGESSIRQGQGMTLDEGFRQLWEKIDDAEQN